MNILYITQSGFSLPSAETTHAIEIIKSFKKLGNEIEVAFSGGQGDIASIGIPFLQHKRNRIIPWRLAFQFWLLWEFLIKGKIRKFDCLYVRQSAMMFAPSILRLFTKVELITEFNTVFTKAAVENSNKLMRMIVCLIEKFTVSSSTKIVVVSSTLIESLQSVHEFEKSKVRVVSNGCNIEFMEAQNKTLSRKKFGLDKNAFIVGFVGHLHPWQGVDVLIESVAELKKAGIRVKAVIAGTSDDIDKYRNYTKELDVEKEVLFLGAVPYNEIPIIISCFDIGLAPGSKIVDSNYLIRSPLKVYEYLANSKPVISGFLPSLESLFSNEIGFLITSGSSIELAERIKDFINNADLLSYMSNNAGDVAKRDLSWDAVAKKILS